VGVLLAFLYCFLSSLSPLTILTYLSFTLTHTHSRIGLFLDDHYDMLLLGRVLYGAAAALHHSVFQNYLDYQHEVSGFPDDWLTYTYRYVFVFVFVFVFVVCVVCAVSSFSVVSVQSCLH
jgi:hypothetical protein